MVVCLARACFKYRIFNLLSKLAHNVSNRAFFLITIAFFSILCYTYSDIHLRKGSNYEPSYLRRKKAFREPN